MRDLLDHPLATVLALVVIGVGLFALTLALAGTEPSSRRTVERPAERAERLCGAAGGEWVWVGVARKGGGDCIIPTRPCGSVPAEATP